MIQLLTFYGDCILNYKYFASIIIKSYKNLFENKIFAIPCIYKAPFLSLDIITS